MYEVSLQGFSTLEKRRLLRIVVAAIVEYLGHVPDKFAQLLVRTIVYPQFNSLQVCETAK